MKRAIIFIGAYNNNRGSEALVRGLTKILKDSISDIEIILSSKDDNGKHIDIPNVDEYMKRYSYNRNNKVIRYFLSGLRYILRLSYLADILSFGKVLKKSRECDLVIVVGADNYDKAYGAFPDMHSFNKTLKKKIKPDTKMVLYDCSLHPDDVTEDILEDFKLFDLVTVRDSITYDGIKKQYTGDNLLLFPDPAFVMEPKEVELPAGFIPQQTIGINLSSLIIGKRYTDTPDLVIQTYVDLLKQILEKTNENILLLPHVMQGKDLVVLREIYKSFAEDERVMLLENEGLVASQLKYIISQCSFFVGARTHATIAAYSSGVPTLVLGYSVKSQGIATDLFGNYDGYVIPVQGMDSADVLTKAFWALYDKKDSIKSHLAQVIPPYVERAKMVGKALKVMLEGEEVL